MKTREAKRRMPAITLPESKALNYALVLNKECEVFTTFGVVNLSVLPDVRSEDTSHASLFMVRINESFHTHKGLSSWQATSEPVAELQQKTQSAGLWDKSSAQTGRYLLLQETLS